MYCYGYKVNLKKRNNHVKINVMKAIQNLPVDLLVDIYLLQMMENDDIEKYIQEIEKEKEEEAEKKKQKK